MANKNKLDLYSASDKRFLDVDSSFAATEFGSVAWSVDVRKNKWQSKKSKKNEIDLTADLRLTDCYKVISLSLSAGNIEQFDERIAKVVTLRNSLNELIAAMKAAKKAGQKHLKSPYETISDVDDDSPSVSVSSL